MDGDYRNAIKTTHLICGVYGNTTGHNSNMKYVCAHDEGRRQHCFHHDQADIIDKTLWNVIENSTLKCVYGLCIKADDTVGSFSGASNRTLLQNHEIKAPSSTELSGSKNTGTDEDIYDRTIFIHRQRNGRFSRNKPDFDGPKLNQHHLPPNFLTNLCYDVPPQTGLKRKAHQRSLVGLFTGTSRISTIQMSPNWSPKQV